MSRSPKYTDQIPPELTGRDRERYRQRLWYQAKREENLKKREAWNRKQGHKKPTGPYRGVNRKTKVELTGSRRYAIIGGEAFFSAKTGFSVKDLRAIIKEITEGQKAKLAS